MTLNRTWPTRACLAGCAALLAAGTAFAQENSELVSLINAYRGSPQTCEGKRTPAAGPLTPDAALARADIASGRQLQDALADAGYQAARAQAIMVSGLPNPSSVMAFIKERYCRLLMNRQYASIGISREDNTWGIVLAQPLFSADLGEWQGAGKEILKLVNTARAKPRTCGNRRFAAAPRLKWNGELARAALAHSSDMAEQNYFRHEGKDGSQASDRASREGYNWRRIGENIATGQGSPKQVVSGWLSSPGHCANIMNRDFAEMGAAFAVNSNSDTKIYWTQVFGTPR